MLAPEEEEPIARGQRVIVWTTEHRGNRYRYIQTSGGRLITYHEAVACRILRLLKQKLQLLALHFAWSSRRKAKAGAFAYV
jgi:hypothetical protein